MLDEKMEKTNDKIVDMCEERECGVEVFEESKINIDRWDIIPSIFLIIHKKFYINSFVFWNV